MTIKDLKTLYDYSYWANKKLFDVIEQIPEEDFTKPIAGSYESIRNTMVHILSAEWGWLDRCGGPARPNRLIAENYPTIASLINTWHNVEGYVRAFLGNLEDADLERQIEYTGSGNMKRSMPLGELLQHTANHAVHHRAQVALLLRMLGHTPGNIDILFYFAEQRGVSAW